MRRTALAVVLAAGLVSFGAAAQTPAATATPASPPQAIAAPAPPVLTAAAAHANDLDEIVCRTSAIVGSRLSSRLCLSKRRWAQMHTDALEFIRVIQASGEGNPREP